MGSISGLIVTLLIVRLKLISVNAKPNAIYVKAFLMFIIILLKSIILPLINKL